jgi:hypothetical protein
VIVALARQQGVKAKNLPGNKAEKKYGNKAATRPQHLKGSNI